LLLTFEQIVAGIKKAWRLITHMGEEGLWYLQTLLTIIFKEDKKIN
jgi:hypothetical protein